MYLNNEEKEKLCKTIFRILTECGGYWITADIYIKQPFNNPNFQFKNVTTAFKELYKIEENKFNSFEVAKVFFKRMGFDIDKEADVEDSKLSSLKYSSNGSIDENFIAFKNAPKMLATWRLRPSLERYHNWD
jgi:hypothetical protein